MLSRRKSGCGLAVAGLFAVLTRAGAEERTFLLRGEVLDASTGKPLACRIYVQDASGHHFYPGSDAHEGSAIRYERQNWVNKESVEAHVTLSAHPFALDLPPGKYSITVERGKEYRELVREAEVKDAPLELRLELERWIDMASLGWFSGDTHVHRGVDELPSLLLAEDLNVAFPLVHWVTKAFEPPSAGDKSMKPPDRDLIPLDPTHVIATRNTEYEIFTVGGKQHTLGAVFALNHGSPLESGVPPVVPVAEEAHRRGALLDLDKHDWPWSLVLVPAMKVDLFELANNHIWRTHFAFTKWNAAAPAYMGLPDEGRSGGELDWILYGLSTYYALLDCGFRLRPTAGTASGVHPVPLGFSRVYVYLGERFSFADWFRGLGEGRSFVTTGPMLLVKVNGEHPGHVFRAGGAEPLEYRASGAALGSRPLKKVEIIVNGEVSRQIEPENRKNQDGAFECRFEETLRLQGSSWIAVRAFEEREGGRVRFAHTGPFHLEVAGAPLRPAKAEVEFLIRRVRDEIERSSAVLPPPALEEYRQALRAYEKVAGEAR